jgi:hypothetical protein
MSCTISCTRAEARAIEADRVISKDFTPRAPDSSMWTRSPSRTSAAPTRWVPSSYYSQ